MKKRNIWLEEFKEKLKTVSCSSVLTFREPNYYQVYILTSSFLRYELCVFRKNYFILFNNQTKEQIETNSLNTVLEYISNEEEIGLF